MCRVLTHKPMHNICNALLSVRFDVLIRNKCDAMQTIWCLLPLHTLHNIFTDGLLWTFATVSAPACALVAAADGTQYDMNSFCHCKLSRFVQSCAR
jgi:hypothetical protein